MLTWMVLLASPVRKLKAEPFVRMPSMVWLLARKLKVEPFVRMPSWAGPLAQTLSLASVFG